MVDQDDSLPRLIIEVALIMHLQAILSLEREIKKANKRSKNQAIQDS